MQHKRAVAQSASEDRLGKLIEERLKAGADKQTIDNRIWDLFGEEWCIMFTDLSGFSRGVARFGIIHFLQTIHESERLLIPMIDKHDGILLKVEGDSFLVIFRNVRKALASAIDMQRLLKEYNTDKADEEQILLCAAGGGVERLAPQLGQETEFYAVAAVFAADLPRGLRGRRRTEQHRERQSGHKS